MTEARSKRRILPLIFIVKSFKRDTPYKKKRKEKDNIKEKVLQLNIKDTKHVFHKDAIFFKKDRYLFCFFAISFSVSYLFFKIWIKCVIDSLLSLRLQSHK